MLIFLFYSLSSLSKPETIIPFLERLKADGGDKIQEFQFNYLHVDYTRFIPMCDQLKGLSLNDALLQTKWNNLPSNEE